GGSHVRCEQGSVRIDLERGSSVAISAHTRFGKVALPGQDEPNWFMESGDQRAVVGDGRASLDIETTMGSVRVTAN
ncbi:MAG: hypothetical protein ACYDAG_05255, partial [Chloroflexota bacterium]